MTSQRTYIAIDLKSFYASVECVERGLDALTTNLVVADKSRTEKTICLAVSPSLKAYGISGRARLFEVVQRVREVNNLRCQKSPRRRLTGRSVHDPELQAHPELAVDYIVAPPRMGLYIQYSARIYRIYLKYIAPEDIHVYSVDEVFMDVTDYLQTYRTTAHELAMKMIHDVLRETGITATAGIGTNMYLCKVAMDIVAKHLPADKNGVRIASLDEQTYRQLLWEHEPLTDFWRVGRGTAARLAPYGIHTMGDIARASLQHEGFLYRLLGVHAEWLIDHAWGWEPVTMEQVKSYRPESRSFSSGQVLTEPYDYRKARVVVREMAEALALDLVDKQLETDQTVLTIGYDVANLTDKADAGYRGEVTTDRYGRRVPKHAQGTENLTEHTSSAVRLAEAVLRLYDRLVNPDLLVRRLTVAVNHVVAEGQGKQSNTPTQLDIFADNEAIERKKQTEQSRQERERRLMKAQLALKKRYGKNAILKGTSFEDGATAHKRNKQIGGHQE